MSKTPKSGDIFKNGHKEDTIVFVSENRRMFWARYADSHYYFEDVIQDTDNPNRWILIW